MARRLGGPAGPDNFLNHPGTTYLGSPNPYPWWGPQAVNTGNINTTYAADGPDFARYNLWGDAITATYDLTDTMTFKSITAYREIAWQIGTSLQGSPGDGIQSVLPAACIRVARRRFYDLADFVYWVAHGVRESNAISMRASRAS